MSDIRIHQEGGVVTVTIDRPAARNAISLATMEELDAALTEVEGMAPSVLVLRGGGDRAFVSGGDLKDLASLRTAEQAAAMAARMRRLLDRVAAMPMPTIAALNGDALGGGAEVSVACDFRVASSDVHIAFNQSHLAIMPAWGGTERLVQLVGRSKALRLLLTGSRLNAAKAEVLGLVDVTASREGFDRAVESFASGIATLPASVSQSIKASVDATCPNHHSALEAGAVHAFSLLWADDAHWEAVEAATNGALTTKQGIAR